MLRIVNLPGVTLYVALTGVLHILQFVFTGCAMKFENKEQMVIGAACSLIGIEGTDLKKNGGIVVEKVQAPQVYERL